MEFSYSQTENFEVEKLSSDTGNLKKNTSGEQQGEGHCKYKSGPCLGMQM